MNKTKYIIQILLIIIFSNCTEDELVKNNKEGIRVTARFATTRTTFTEDNSTTHVTWNAGDKIGLSTNEQTNLQYIAEHAGNTTEFTTVGEQLKATENQKVYAYYPYTNSSEVEKQTVKLTPLHSQYYKESTSDYDFIYATGNVTNKELTLHFKHIFAFLKIKIPTNMISALGKGCRLYISSSENLSISTESYFDLEKGEIISSNYSDVTHYYLPKDTESLKNKNDITCYIAILPQTKDAVIRISIIDQRDLKNCLLIKKVPNCGFKAGNVYSLCLSEHQNITERDALIAIYSATNGDKWTNNDNWCSDKPIKEWYGVEVDNNGDLLALKLSNNNLDGILPAEIGYLPTLRQLYLDNNRLRGNIPVELGYLSLLYYLRLEGNLLSGTIPNELCYLTNLFRLSLYGNNLSGSLPTDLSKLLDSERLEELDFGYNCLTGKIPEEVLHNQNFPYFAGSILSNQKKGYGLDMSTTKTPAVKRSYSLFDNSGTINLGEEYAKNEYTLLFRWVEWCPYTEAFTPTITELEKRYKNASFQIIGAYGSGNLSEGEKFMKNYGMIKWKHFIESDGTYPYRFIWLGPTGYSYPFIEVVDRSGNIVFLDDSGNNYLQLPIAHKRNEITDFLRSVLGEGDKLYESTDYSKDGNVTLLQQASEGKGIDIILIGDAFSDRLIADGTYNIIMQKTVKYLFTEEPFKSFRHLFNIYMVDAVSKNEFPEGETALSTYFGEGTHVGGNDNKCFEYAQKAISANRIDEALIVVMINSTKDAGTCWMYSPSTANTDYGSGPSIAYFPIGISEVAFEQVLHHEANGHGFSKLSDEYAYQYQGTIPATEIEKYQIQAREFGWWKNVDFTNSPTHVKWSKYFSDNRYKNDGLGIFEGACTYWTGAYRPTNVSIMRYNTEGFNAPSRESIYYRIHKLAYGSPWVFDYEKFVAYDAINRKTSVHSDIWDPNKMKHFLRKHCPPIVVRGNWRNAQTKDK